MGDTTKRFDISDGKVTPTGTDAPMSRSGTSLHNQGIWINNDDEYDYMVTLSSNAWRLKPGQTGDCSTASLSFTIPSGGNVSCVYQLKTDAPLGSNPYTCSRIGAVRKEMPGGDPTDPDVIINS
jgi:hypothetical protein